MERKAQSSPLALVELGRHSCMPFFSGSYRKNEKETLSHQVHTTALHASGITFQNDRSIFSIF